MPGCPNENTIAQLKALQFDGRYLDAWSLIKELDPPEQWPAAEWRLRGGRLIERLGGKDRAARLYFREWRRADSRAEARSEMFYEVLRRRGAVLAWQWLDRNAPAADEAPGRHEDHQGHLAVVLTELRDFEEAERCLKRGHEWAPTSRWLTLLGADLLQAQDQRQDALMLTGEVLAAEPMYISAICSHAELLSELRRDDEAIFVLQEASQRVQSGQVQSQLAALLAELKRYEEAWEALDRYEKMVPLCQEKDRDWLCGMRCDLASHRGDVAEALRWAEQVKKHGFYQRVAEKLRSSNGTLRRHLLPVPFVQQHHSTCAPASVTSIALFWQRSVEHMELAESICYDGTPDYKERRWAETNGWEAREFRVTVEAAKLLLDAGMPFVLNTVYAGGAHAQVVTGYDECRTVLFIRDPGNRHTSEFLAAEALEEQAPFGPRGFVMVPQADAARLAAIELPDADLYNLTHAIDVTLDRHDRPCAMRALEDLRRDHGDHLLRWHGELVVARYDGNHSQVLAGLEEMLRLHPKVVNWQTERLHMIREVRGRAAMVAALQETCAAKDSHPIHWRMLARELHWDERHTAAARRWLKRVHRVRVDGQALLTEANIWWERREREKATALYRLAACLEDKNEGIVMAYFRATIWVRQSEVALALMRRRFENEGGHSAQPGITLYRALSQMNLGKECLEVLEESLRRRPDDDEHAVFVAGELVLWNRIDRARAILERTGQARRAAAWHRVQARLAKQEGNGAAQLLHWRAVLQDDPLDADAYRAVAWLLELQEGVPAALDFLGAACERFPFHWGLHIVLLDWSRDQGFEKWEAAVRQLLRIDPDDGWARREWADVLRAAKRYAEAHAELDHAATLDEDHPALHTMRASVLEDEGRLGPAQVECRAALILDVDNTYALRGVARLCQTQEQRLEALRFIQAELQRQTTNGDAVLEFAEVARPYLSDAALEQVLREGRQARPDLWQTGVTLAEHLRHTGRTEEAVEIMEALKERFPLMSRVWMELGLCLEIQGDRAAAIEATCKVRELNPSWNWGMRTLSELMRKSGDYEGARSVLEEGLRYSPRDALHHGWLADVLWHVGDKDAALHHLTQAVEIDPGYAWAWDMLGSRGRAAGKPDAAREAARRLLRERPAEVRTWLIYAEQLTKSDELEERLSVLDKAIELAPEGWRPVEFKARVLALAGRYQEALQLCRKHPSGSVELRLREAWTLHRKGHLDEAVQAMEAALHDDPNHVWGWQLLVEWYQEQKKTDQAEQACRQLVRLQPTEARALGYLGGLQLAQQKRAEARASFERALAVEPDYDFAFNKLFWMHIEDRQWSHAATVAEQIRPHQSTLQQAFRQYVQCCRRSKWPEAHQWLAEMLADPEDDEDIFNCVLAEMGLMPDPVRAQECKLIVAALRAPAPNVNAGWLYVELAKVRGRLPKTAVLALLPVDTVAAERAHAQYLYWLGAYGAAHNLDVENLFGLRVRLRWRRLMRDHGEWYRSRADLYGAVSYALHKLELHRTNVAWLRDWRDRPEMQPYMLNNLILSLHRTNHGDEARQVIERGLTHPTHNAIKLRFHLWAAMDAALDEDLPRVAELMDAVNPANLDDFGCQLKDFLDVMMEFLNSADTKPPGFRQVRIRVSQFMIRHRKDPVMTEVALRTCRLIGKKLGSSYPVLWFRLYRYGLLLRVRG